jgi:acyl-CoA reductase-like NAD-dependent aldehyde dehydrogenase
MIREIVAAKGGRQMQQIFIAGAWVDPGEGANRDISNPATRQPLGAVCDCGSEDVARALAAARAALPAWQGESAATRGVLLGEVAARMRVRKAEIAALATCENGVPLRESADCIEAAALMLERWAAGAQSANRERAAVVAGILPRNFSLLAFGAATAPALAAGSTLVILPPADNPLSSLMLAESFGELHPGVVNVVTGDRSTAQALSAQVERAALEQRQAESAFVVSRDADLDITVPAIAWERLRHGGQIFAAARHIFVEHSIKEEFVERMHQCIGFLDVDDPIKPPTDLGPLISLEAAQCVEDQVGRMLRAGAKLILGGRRFRPSGLPGHFFQPTLLVLRDGAPAPEVISGPVVTITPVRDLTEGLRLARAAEGSSSASIYTRDVDAAVALARSCGGWFRINDPPLPGAAGPFSGMRHPALRAALRVDEPSGAGDLAIEVAAAIERKAWWFPYVDRAQGRP